MPIGTGCCSLTCLSYRVISTSFGCPYEGDVPVEQVLDVALRLAAAGCAEVGFGDTTGMANPVQVRRFFATVRERFSAEGFEAVELTEIVTAARPSAS